MSNLTLTDAQTARVLDAADRVGTPFYLYDAETLRQRVSDLQTQLPDVDFFYSLKANPNLSVVSTLVGAGTGAEVSSRLELETALEAGAPPEGRATASEEEAGAPPEGGAPRAPPETQGGLGGGTPPS